MSLNAGVPWGVLMRRRKSYSRVFLHAEWKLDAPLRDDAISPDPRMLLDAMKDSWKNCTDFRWDKLGSQGKRIMLFWLESLVDEDALRQSIYGAILNGRCDVNTIEQLEQCIQVGR